MCAADRPADYREPDNYVPTDEELQMMAQQQELDRQALEYQERRRRQEGQQRLENYQQLLHAADQSLVVNTEDFTCPICFDDIAPGDGVVLRDCLHMFCKSCLQAAVTYSEEAAVKCPYQDDNYTCPSFLQDMEIKALVSNEVFQKYLQLSLSQAESQAANSYHCKTADCRGWCIYEDEVNFFDCPVCGKKNCLTCKAIHEGINCKQYQEDLQIRAGNDKAAKQTNDMLEKLIRDGDAMRCPHCRVIVQKKDGCDWIKCSFCKTEICWVTRGPRWGPAGPGDISGGCMCRVNAQRCHDNCQNCH
ncbi:ranBP-type and C3HC4-type zinc finger-containing protein 1 [Lingula anatina]|uniref:RanBP-type and C3HC4-type zinc finger-containing protein 1 n=1 Tax=Lingula anatina TaxID=7574 RepID=A0A2R2MRA6_LINAN|nr:ranBP-type and C3HC4-type zinc finger-containing protein 1 [Lingula anatina]|eukprot:XP_023932780.1 ranBP-type and C3HC4-type zinc finger-containing protein 1 [Lingula anatina]